MKFERNQVKTDLIILLSFSLKMCSGCLKELSHWGGSFEYPQHVLVEKFENLFFIAHFYLEAWYMYLVSMLKVTIKMYKSSYPLS